MDDIHSFTFLIILCCVSFSIGYKRKDDYNFDDFGFNLRDVYLCLNFYGIELDLSMVIKTIVVLNKLGYLNKNVIRGNKNGSFFAISRYSWFGSKVYYNMFDIDLAICLTNIRYEKIDNVLYSYSVIYGVFNKFYVKSLNIVEVDNNIYLFSNIKYRFIFINNLRKLYFKYYKVDMFYNYEKLTSEINSGLNDSDRIRKLNMCISAIAVYKGMYLRKKFLFNSI